MKIDGLPHNFWLVLKPSSVSTITDICFRCNFRQFAQQIRGGLNEAEIIGVFADENSAFELASQVLQRNE